MMLALAGLATIISCSDDDPAPTDPEDAIKGSTWQFNGALMPTQGIENLRVTFDENLDAIGVSYILNSTEESYDGQEVSGRATVVGEDVDIEVGFGFDMGQVDFDGTLDEGRTSGSGIVSHSIMNEGGDPTQLSGIDPDGTIVKQ